MATYSFIIRKGNYQLELKTSDKELLSEQFELWVREAGEYAKLRKAQEGKNIVNAQIKAEEEITQKNIDAQLRKKEPESVVAEEIKRQEDVFVEDGTKQIPPASDLDIFYAPQSGETVAQKANEENQNGVFDNILEKSVNNPQTELSFKPTPSIKKDSAFINFMSAQRIEKKIDYLLFAAYYYSQYEQKPRFTLKQLNSKLMQNLAVIIDHSVLQEAINRDYIECLPDLTGLIGASEYRLTAYGEKTIMDS